ncbi:MAG: hypothetical protein RBS81_12395 [Tenuifilaceae bacterium]|jgi:cytidine deaminase|nr:hypothetical protein [Tenuifilaceae bacterium]
MRKQSQNSEWETLSIAAWKVRENAHLFGKTKVGASVMSENDNIFTGCNIEHMFRSHDVHAEVNAISSLVSSGDRKIKRILIVAERDFFTPCGSCMDWIMQFAYNDTLIGFQKEKGGEIQIFTPSELMPFYPK